MSRIPEEHVKISAALQQRVIDLIKDEDCGANGGECSNAEFAARAGVSKNVISHITNYGLIPSVKSLVKIADYLNVSLEYLLGKTENQEFTASDTPSSFGERLLQLKTERNVKFADITNCCSFSRNSIHVWLKRNNLPALDYLFQLAKFFGVSPDYLLGRTDYRN